MGKREKLETTAREVESHPAAVFTAAVGQVVNGVVHIIIGMIAVGVARGAGGSADQSGAMRAIASTPLGTSGLWVAGLALYALALHSWATAVAQWRRSTMKTLRHAGRGAVNAVVATIAINYAMGGSSDGDQTARSVSAQLLATTWGSWLLALIGLMIFGVGVGMIVSGIRQRFMQDLHVSGSPRRAFAVLGTTGYLAKGTAVCVVGALFVLAVITRNPDEAGGLDSALKKLVELPFGQILLVLVAVGLMLYGLFCFARARALTKRR